MTYISSDDRPRFFSEIFAKATKNTLQRTKEEARKEYGKSAEKNPKRNEQALTILYNYYYLLARPDQAGLFGVSLNIFHFSGRVIVSLSVCFAAVFVHSISAVFHHKFFRLIV